MSESRLLLSLPSDIRDDLLSEKITLREARRLFRRRKSDKEGKKVEVPSGKFRVFYVDPPWKYGDSGLDDYGHAEAHYAAMSISELCAMDVKSLAEENAVLFLWVTSPMLEEAFKVIRAWGFEYKASFVWDKVKHNFGHYNSVRHEFLLICTRGSCTPDNSELFDSVQSIERSAKHSEKPEGFRKIIEKMYTHGKKLELFGRKKAEGWTVHGNENLH